ncbi:MAG: cryptochrome/photolyase family protein [Crocinitomicaceae bacterium]|nr:MAG: cryptochrome/photolyase family protein [Crocinitomicaceae bacterium]
MDAVFIVFPNHLFKDLTKLQNYQEVWLIEEFLFFRQYNFHKQKLVLHRASMKAYANYLIENGISVRYIESTEAENDIRKCIATIASRSFQRIAFYDVCDDWLNQRINSASLEYKLEITSCTSPLFLNSEAELHDYFAKKKSYFHADFYMQERKKRNILVDELMKPIGGKWSFDDENRKKYPAKKTPPAVDFPTESEIYQEAKQYVETHFGKNLGQLSSPLIYPTTHVESERWFQQFLTNRFEEFGDFEDAIVDHQSILHHSALTPMLNIGLLTPKQIVEATLEYASHHPISMNSLEGFIRQIIGWREFIRGVYVFKGRTQRTQNYWKFKREIPASFYDGTTGIKPIDTIIHKILETGYCHHIERLMVLGNFMLLCGFHPDQVYVWFMELFIDAYDWVMVPNVYGMSQFADGGILATKPYISGSNYILKMSNFKKGDWCLTWDALFWQFMHEQRAFFSSNPRLGMLLRTYDHMPEEKRNLLQKTASDFLMKLEKK